MMQRLTMMLCLLAILLAAPLSGRAETPAFTFADVQAKAQDLARAPYADTSSAPQSLANISYDDWAAIRYRSEKALWADEGLPFTVQFFHPGLHYDRVVRVNIIGEENVAPVRFSPSLFQYGSEAAARQITASGAADFAGFRIHYALNRPDYKDELAVFLGASYFRALAKDTHYGIYGRGLALDTACGEGEEFPYFKEFWIMKPAADAKDITVYALMDSPSLAGAYRFVITPGAPTVMDVKCALFPREGGRTFHKTGLAALTSMFFYGEETNGRPGDFRPEVHNSDGLLFTDGTDGWTWSPLSNPRRLSVNAFPLDNPRGFGLMQRDSSFSSYQDVNAHYEQRPSLWVQPEGDWGPGRLELIEIPTSDEWHRNIVAFWTPAEPSKASVQMYGWKMFWMHPTATPHSAGRVVSTRQSFSGDTMTFHVDFAGGQLSELPEDTGIASVVETPETVALLEKKLMRNPAIDGWRLEFKVRLPKEEGVIKSLMSARKGPLNLRFRAQLKKGENLPGALTETWLYDWQYQPQQ